MSDLEKVDTYREMGERETKTYKFTDKREKVTKGKGTEAQSEPAFGMKVEGPNIEMKREVLKKLETKECYVRDWSIDELGPSNILKEMNEQLPEYVQFGSEHDILSWGSVTRTTM